MFSIQAGMPEPPLVALGTFQVIHHSQSCPADRGDNQLGNAVALCQSNGLPPMIDENDPDLPPIIGVNGSGAVDKGDPLLKGQSRARTNLSFKTFRNRHGQAGRNQSPLPRFKDQRFVKGGTEIHPGSQCGHISGKYGIWPNPFYLNGNRFHNKTRCKRAAGLAESKVKKRKFVFFDIANHLKIEIIILHDLIGEPQKPLLRNAVKASKNFIQHGITA